MARRSPYRDEYEEMVERQQRRPRRERQEQKRGTPLLLKCFSWLGVILLCFVLGYLGTNILMEGLNKKLLLKPENRVEGQADLNALEEAERSRAAAPESGENVQQVGLMLYYVKGDTVVEEKRNFVARTKEDNIKDALNAVLSLSGVPGLEQVKLLHVFRNAETAFLDLSSPFVSALSSLGQRKSLLLLTGIVRTMQDNFSPVTQVRFLIDSKTPASGGVVDLTVPWKMPSRS
ncbi:MAG: GerMN domain-containing protein [Fretibacterium sp.]|nr:GerMN domain-containing protein [Fretibacterium sp.]